MGDEVSAKIGRLRLLATGRQHFNIQLSERFRQLDIEVLAKI